jgi:hypothetical protein
MDRRLIFRRPSGEVERVGDAGITGVGAIDAPVPQGRQLDLEAPRHPGREKPARDEPPRIGFAIVRTMGFSLPIGIDGLGEPESQFRIVLPEASSHPAPPSSLLLLRHDGPRSSSLRERLCQRQ